MLYCNDRTNIFHVHIPRTAGRYIKSLFVENKFDCYFWNYNDTYKGIEVPHLHYPLYNVLEDVEECPHHFTIVRNPYQRFKSLMDLIIVGRQYPDEIYSVLKDKDWLFNFLENEKDISLYKCNSFTSQVDFVSERTKIYKMEDGINKNFVNWINQIFSLDLKNLKIDYDIGGVEPILINSSTKPSDKFDPIIEEYIKEYYEEDYKKFNY